MNASTAASSLNELERKRDDALRKADEGPRGDFHREVAAAGAYGEAARMLRSLLETHRATIHAASLNAAAERYDRYPR